MAEQQHLDRLSAVDASFLIQEGANTHMHIGGVATFEGPSPGYEEFLAHIDTRLSLVPRYRQKIAVPPLRAGRPLWIDDPSFNLPYHVRHTALPSPGSEEQLLRLTGRVFSQRLDRTKPLWEIWLVDGYNGSGSREESGRFALLTKTHHALVDGVSGVDLMTMLFDVTPVPREVERAEWLPQPEPSGAQMVANGVKAVVDGAVELAAGALGALGRPRHAVDRARETVEGIAEVAWAGLNPPPETPLSADIGPHRRFQVVHAPLGELKQIKNALGGTVNDVVLAVVAGALTRFLRTRGVRTEGLQLRACVPVSVREESGRGAMGNQITQILCPLPVYVGDPVERVRIVRDTMDGLKESKQALGAEAIASMENFAPPTLLAQASRLHFSSRMYTLLVTNIPGPQFPLYVLGREMQDMVPVPFLGGERALAIAILSYNGRIDFGLLGDYDSLPDLDLIAGGVRDSIAELLAVAQRARPSEGAPAKATARGASNGSPD